MEEGSAGTFDLVGSQAIRVLASLFITLGGGALLPLMWESSPHLALPFKIGQDLEHMEFWNGILQSFACLASPNPFSIFHQYLTSLMMLKGTFSSITSSLPKESIFKRSHHEELADVFYI